MGMSQAEDEIMDATPITINDWVRHCFEIAESKGFHAVKEYEGVERVRSAPESMMLIVSEVSEMLEAYRVNGIKGYVEADGKPEGVGAELADVVIRCFDFAGIYNIDLETLMRHKSAYNTTRSHMHGGKKM